ncbi:glycosyltransferase family 4 protein [Advenella sp. WQ 585]|uniref:Glycosyltransferase family 4 protein n=1 Tax=Advenella mandrilli TaxID=2800330 RepID=A0ABS1EFT7_9BURK|nr:glycosyltransferase family 4 protein [Advenella mandrilli]MBK1781740.1 glycosyltransferase family 4 protein [Advenella mandrilli]
MKIVLIGTVSSSIFGFRKLLLQSLVKDGHEVFILTTDLTPDIQQRALDELNVRAEKYTLARTGMNPVTDIRNAWSLYRRLKELQPDCVFCYFSKPVIWGSLAALFAGIKQRYGMLEGLGYYFTHTPKGNTLKKKLVRTAQIGLFHLSLPALRGLVVLNPDDKHDLIEKYHIKQNNVMVLGGIGLDLDEYSYSEPDISQSRFIFVGRLLAEKGINEFLQAAEIVKERHPKSEFIVLGKPDPGNPGSVNQGYLNNLVTKNIVIYPGSVSNVADWLKDSSVFVLPSYREGVPRSTQEAMAIGRPVITTDVPGCRETIRNGENGFMVPPHSAQAVANAMEKFITEPNLLLSMGRRSRELAAENFNADKVNQRLLDFLKL